MILDIVYAKHVKYTCVHYVILDLMKNIRLCFLTHAMNVINLNIFSGSVITKNVNPVYVMIVGGLMTNHII